VTDIPHASFSGSPPPDAEFNHPPGMSLARLLHSHLRKHFEAVSEPRTWRDIGWSVSLQVNGKEFEVYFAPFPSSIGQWLLAVSPVGQPGLLARVFGRKPITCSTELRAIATQVHSTLGEISVLSAIRWFFGGPPGSQPTVSIPVHLPWGVP
jgi:hypothetical protein